MELKRATDILLASASLVILAPLLLIAATLVRIDSPGPILYRQERVGLRGRIFQIHKFRTMRPAPGDQGPHLSVGRDPRTTRVGHWLRRSKIDELPQLIDVLVGDMSLVGPRPEVPHYVAFYPTDLRDKILSVRPGMTDLASIEYRHEGRLLATATDPEREYLDVVMPAKLRLAAEYVDGASFLGDLRIMCRTVAAVFS